MTSAMNKIETEFSIGAAVTIKDGWPGAGGQYTVIGKVAVPDNMVRSVGNYHWYDLGPAYPRVSGAILQAL